MRAGAPAATDGRGPNPRVFPEDEFRLTVDPAALRASMAPHRRAQALAAAAMPELSRLTAPDWTGAEGDLYRDRLQSYTAVPTAMVSAMEAAVRQVESFAATAEEAQRRMQALAWAARTTHQALVQQAIGPLLVLHPSPPPGDRSTAGYGQCLPSQAQFDQQRAWAADIKKELLAAARATAAAISGIPAPPPVPVAAGALTPEQIDDVQEDVVVKRESFEGTLRGVFTSAFAELGLTYQVETLENGRVKVTILPKVGAGVKLGIPELKGPVEIHGDGEISGALSGGTVQELDASEVPGYLVHVALWFATMKSLPVPTKDGGVIVGGEIRAAVEAEGASESVGSIKASAEGKASFQLEQDTDGTTEAAFTIEGGGGVEGKVAGVEDPPDPVKDAPRGPLSKVDPGVDLPVPMQAAAAAGGAYTVKLTRKPDGTCALTRIDRTQKQLGASPEGPKTVAHEVVTTRAVSAAEAQRIFDDLRDPARRKEGLARVRELAKGLDAEKPGPDVQRHEYDYEIDQEDIADPKIEVKKGTVDGVEGHLGTTREKLLTKDGHPVPPS